MLTLQAPQAETLWDEVLPIEVKELPEDLARLDEFLRDPGLLRPVCEHWQSEGEARRCSARAGNVLAAAQAVVGVGADGVLARAAADRLSAPVARLDPVVARARVVDVAARAADEPIGASAAGEAVVAVLTQEAIMTRAPDEAIMAISSAHPVGAAEREDQVAARLAVEDVGPGGAADLIGAAPGSKGIVGIGSATAATAATPATAASTAVLGGDDHDVA